MSDVIGLGIQSDLHETVLRATAAILQSTESAQNRITAEQRAEVKSNLHDGTGQLALLVLNDGKQIHVEIALINAEVKTVFDRALLTLDGPILAAAETAAAMYPFDRSRMN